MLLNLTFAVNCWEFDSLNFLPIIGCGGSEDPRCALLPVRVCCWFWFTSSSFGVHLVFPIKFGKTSFAPYCCSRCVFNIINIPVDA